ncbi:uncharacterized protein VTP21DRAFT_9405 [Calcarisporiella thermophila]|uniref:uncharacterized protein n=1 Tax=Calcarisporiella thermophila TaxID=911321 RepID=UPI00374232A0
MAFSLISKRLLSQSQSGLRLQDNTSNLMGRDSHSRTGELGHDARNYGGLFKDKDWKCSVCGNINWAKRTNCNICSTLKPEVRASLGERTGRGGGFKERDDKVEYRRRDDDDEWDEFGRKKKKKGAVESKKNEEDERHYREEEEDEDEDEDEDKDDAETDPDHVPDHEAEKDFTRVMDRDLLEESGDDGEVVLVPMSGGEAVLDPMDGEEVGHVLEIGEIEKGMVLAHGHHRDGDENNVQCVCSRMFSDV